MMCQSITDKNSRIVSQDKVCNRLKYSIVSWQLKRVGSIFMDTTGKVLVLKMLAKRGIQGSWPKYKIK
jgi:hypothetical protein